MVKKALTAVLVLLACCSILAATDQKDKTAKPKPAKKNPAVVVLDMDRLVKESTLAQKYQGEIKAMNDSLQAQFQPRMQAFQQKRNEYQADEAKLSPEEKDRRQKELQALQQQVMDVQQKSRADLQKKQEATSKLFHDHLMNLIKSLAQENGWDLIVNRSEEVSIWSSEALDNTDFVLEKLNSLPDPPAPKADTSADPQAPTPQPAAVPAPPPPAPQPDNK